ncbi:MAG: DUF1987 domain-containing protein [Flavobacteriales bacterium]|nr:DUF1987 domain-containing protein [Flavobacteriales bacterium]MBL0126345.1 DUF1987 domain-containing protein [Flavobacteriales bacterium]MCC6936986.1 DUF1987 domain-containing protein [Flavobacteriales bacterium]
MPGDGNGFRLEGTQKTPTVHLDPTQGLLTISGSSIPENADRFYTPVFDAVERYCAQPASRTTVVISLNYFNTSSAKYLLDLLKRLEDMHAAGTSKLLLEWHHSPRDLDMAEAGRDYRALLEFPVKLVEKGL